MKPIHKGNGTICHNCGKAITFEWRDILYCDKCEQQNKNIEQLEKEGK